MRIFLAGATGVIGTRLVPLLLAEGHEVAGLTRSPEKGAIVSEMGATPVVGDVFDGDWLTGQVTDFGTEMILHELTDLPDDLAEIGAYSWNNAMIRRQGTANLLAAARSAGADKFLVQSVAWPLGGGPGDAVSDMESAVLTYGGVVLRYGQLYGPGTYHPDSPPDHPRIHVDDAARRTVDALTSESGIILLVDPADTGIG